MLVISLQYIDRIKLITYELSNLGQAESYYSFAQNVQREMIYDPSKTVLGSTSFEVARDTLSRLYAFNSILRRDHFENRNILSSDYLQEFDRFYQNDLC